jgi:hypothetical protein
LTPIPYCAMRTDINPLLTMSPRFPP